MLETYKADKMWRFLFFFPSFVNLFMILVFKTCIGEDSINYNLKHGNDEAALKLIKKMYDVEDYQALLEHLRSQI